MNKYNICSNITDIENLINENEKNLYYLYSLLGTLQDFENDNDLINFIFKNVTNFDAIPENILPEFDYLGKKPKQTIKRIEEYKIAARSDND